MDKRLIILIAAFCTVALAFFIYRKVYYKHDGIRYTIRPRDAINAGDSIAFQDQTEAASRWKWDFGDGEYSAARSGNHTYTMPGMYIIKHTVYGSFGVLRNENTDTVVVSSAGAIPVATLVPSITGPAELQAGKPGRFESDMAATAYEWHVDGDPRMSGRTDKGSEVTYVFASAGVRTIVLKTTNPDHETRKSVNVVAAASPVTTPPPPPVRTPRPAQPRPRPHGGSGLPDLDNGVEYQKNH